jgi:hypothetical protein
LFVYPRMWCFAVPPLLGLLAITRTRDGAAA